MHQHVGLPSGLLDELVGLLEEAVQLVIFVVLGRDVEVVRDVFSGVLEEATARH